jgi:hypothetical protein
MIKIFRIIKTWWKIYVLGRKEDYIFIPNVRRVYPSLYHIMNSVQPLMSESTTLPYWIRWRYSDNSGMRRSVFYEKPEEVNWVKEGF